MNEDAAAKELERLLRDALDAKPDPAHRKAPVHQLRTVPLAVQPIPVRRPEGPRPSPARAGEEELAEGLAPDAPAQPEASAAPRRSRWSLVAVAAIGALALAAAGGAIWQARERGVAAQAHASPTAQEKERIAPAEGALGIALTARPADVAAQATTEPVAAAGAGAGAGAEVEASATSTATAAEDPKGTAQAPPAKTTTAKEPERAHRAPRAARPQPRAQKTEAAAVSKAERAEAPKTEAAAAPKAERSPPPSKAAPAAKSVDALLQQQLSGAIP